jgi:hypothetical protein
VLKFFKNSCSWFFVLEEYLYIDTTSYNTSWIVPKSHLTLTKLGSGGVSGTGVRSVVTSLSQGLNLPFPVFARCVMERYSFWKFAQNNAAPSVHLERAKSRPNWWSASPALSMARDGNWLKSWLALCQTADHWTLGLLPPSDSLK